MTVIALVPAHNEEGTVTSTVTALLGQQHSIDRIIVVADNCTDDTIAVALRAGAEVFTSVDNTHMKAGALNQALDSVLPYLEDSDIITCVDADSIVGDNFISEALLMFEAYSDLGGVSGTYQGKRGGGLVGWCQRNEFSRWGYDNRKEGGNTVILSGAASVFTVRALRRVISARASGQLSGENVYNTGNITEDFELSLALLHTGNTIRNMLNVRIDTAVKPTWRELGVQRLRWDRGINEGLFQYGITKHTRLVWARRVMYALYVPVSFLCLLLIAIRVGVGVGYSANTFWLSITGVMMLQKGITVIRSRGIKNALGAVLIVFELPYDTFLQFIFVRSVINGLLNSQKTWR